MNDTTEEKNERRLDVFHVSRVGESGARAYPPVNGVSSAQMHVAIFVRRWWPLAALLAAAHAPIVAAAGRLSVDAGIDWRYYDVVCDNPVIYQANQSAQSATDTQRETYYQYFRLRTRPWGRLTLDERYDLYARLGHEFRVYDNNKQSYRFPDELFVDSLYA
ncbi:MAG: hypothetical protein PHN34_09425, partial [Kiritimatiellae bacterium]|nr:hypothetical protein [Kiritimatiellia bacterium]